MRFENQGMVLWYGLPDTPVPSDVVPEGHDIPITIGVSPADASNLVEVLYRINRDLPRAVPAGIPRHIGSAQYFQAILHAAIFRAGDEVRYVAVCHCAGRQVPSAEQVEEFPSLFRINGTATSLCSPLKIPSTFDESTLAPALASRMAGSPANGTPQPEESPPQVIWVDSGDEVLVHLDSTQVRLLDRTLLVSVDLETDQTGRTPLVVALALGSANDPAGLIAATDQYPRGNGLLAARWGRALQSAVWASFLDLANDHASERGLAQRGLSVSAGQVTLVAGEPLSAASVIASI